MWLIVFRLAVVFFENQAEVVIALHSTWQALSRSSSLSRHQSTRGDFFMIVWVMSNSFLVYFESQGNMSFLFSFQKKGRDESGKKSRWSSSWCMTHIRRTFTCRPERKQGEWMSRLLLKIFFTEWMNRRGSEVVFDQEVFIKRLSLRCVYIEKLNDKNDMNKMGTILEGVAK